MKQSEMEHVLRGGDSDTTVADPVDADRTAETSLVDDAEP